MDIVTIDFETYWALDYTLSKLTTEAYVRDPRFESILCSIKVNDEKTYWVPRDAIAAEFETLHLDKCAVLCHHSHFDGFILHHHYGIRPRLHIDTLGMARALHGANGRLSLAKLAERYGIGVKGTEVHNTKGMRFADFSPEALKRYGAYSVQDTDLTHALAQRMMPHFSKTELEINDAVIRMFTEPCLRQDIPKLQRYADGIRAEKSALMLQAGVQRADLMSADKFAQELINLGVKPPQKISAKQTEKAGHIVLAYAFAKTDPGMQALIEHPDERVQILVAARLKNKTTVAEASADRMVAMNERGLACIYNKFSGASGTHRLSAGDKINYQAMQRGGEVRQSIEAVDGSMIVVGDSSNIEARMVDWLAGQDDMVQVYRDYDRDPLRNPDMYCVIGGRIYERAITKADKAERQMGKVAKLGLGFGMGVQKFIISTRAQAKGLDGKPLVLDPSFAVHVHGIYRKAHPQVLLLWKRCEEALKAISQGRYGVDVDYQGIVKTCKDGLLLPNGQKILYPDLKYEKNTNPGGWGGEWTFWNGKMRERIHGPKVCENIVQALARIVVLYQCLAFTKDINKQEVHSTKWAHSVHDEGVFSVRAYLAPWALELLLDHMRRPLDWCKTLPLNSEGGFHKIYGKAKT